MLRIVIDRPEKQVSHYFDLGGLFGYPLYLLTFLWSALRHAVQTATIHTSGHPGTVSRRLYVPQVFWTETYAERDARLARRDEILKQFPLPK